MPSLPRIRRLRSRENAAVAARPRVEPAELSASGLTWIHLDAPDNFFAGVLASRFGWHPLDVEDVMSKRQRPKVDDYADDGYLFLVLHFPVYDRAVQRLNAAELDVFIGPDYLVTLPNVELLPVTRLFARCANDAYRLNVDASSLLAGAPHRSSTQSFGLYAISRSGARSSTSLSASDHAEPSLRV